MSCAAFGTAALRCSSLLEAQPLRQADCSAMSPSANHLCSIAVELDLRIRRITRGGNTVSIRLTYEKIGSSGRYALTRVPLGRSTDHRTGAVASDVAESPSMFNV